jgi:hypothetical protein
MLTRFAAVAVLILGVALSGFAQEGEESMPVELEVLKAWVGVWDAAIEVWPQGLDSASTTFTGVETIKPYGEYWVASDFDSEFMGQTMTVHSVVGYDLDKKMLVGMIVDHGPYAATMTGEYDAESRTVTWMTRGKYPNGNPIAQRTVMTQKDAVTRELVLTVPGETEGEYNKFMQITYTKRAESPAKESTAAP